MAGSEYPLIKYEILKTPDDWKAHDVNFIRDGKIEGTGYIDKAHPKFLGLVTCPCCGLKPKQADSRLGICTRCGWQTLKALMY